MIPGVCRFAVNQRIAGQQVVNIVDMQIDTTGSEVSRADAVFEVAGDILNNWTDHILTLQVDELQAESVSWLDLDSLSGSVGERTSTSAEVWPQGGTQTTQAVLPSLVALRIDKNTEGGRGTKKGRMYLSGMNEGATDAGVALSWSSGFLPAAQAGVDAFLAGINDQDIGGVPLAVQRQMVVVHATAGTYSEVRSLSVNPLISTQVRRGALR